MATNGKPAKAGSAKSKGKSKAKKVKAPKKPNPAKLKLAKVRAGHKAKVAKLKDRFSAKLNRRVGKLAKKNASLKENFIAARAAHRTLIAQHRKTVKLMNRLRAFVQSN